MSTKGIRLPSFTVNEKLRIVREAEEIGNRAAGRKYDVPESCIRDWRETKEILLKSSGNRRAFRGQKARYPKIDEKLLTYVSEKRQFGYAVSTKMCQLKALALAKEQGIDGFKASRRWIMRFFLQ
jgi:transposase-like protein